MSKTEASPLISHFFFLPFKLTKLNLANCGLHKNLCFHSFLHFALVLLGAMKRRHEDLETPSMRARQDGNRELERSQKDGLCRVLCEKHLQSAINCYSKALMEAKKPGECCSARKNLSWAHKLWADMLESKSAGVIESKLTQDQELQIYHVCEALGQIKEVLSNLISDQDVVILTMGIEWVQQLTARANDMYLNFRCWCWSSSSLIRRIYNRLPTQELCITCRYDEAETIFLACVKRKEDYKFVLGQLPSCEMPLREAALGAAKLGLAAKNDACQTLLESVQIEICVGKSAQAIECGDSVLTAAVNSSDSLNMEGVWDAIDFYHEAIVQAKEKDIENEARANSQLGSVYKNIIKIKSTANRYFSQ